MRSDIFMATAVTLAIILSGLPAPAGAGAGGARIPDGDNNFASATAMTPGTAYPGSLDSSDDPQDYYSAQSAAPGQVFNVSVQVFSYPTGTVRLVAYDPAMAMLEESSLGGPWESLSIEEVKWSTNYFFAVFITAGTVASYSIQVVLETPKTISWSGSDGGNLARSSDNPADWYVCTLAGGDINDVAVFTIYHDSTVTIDAWIYDLWPGLTTSVCNISLNHTSGKTIAFAGTHSDPWYHLKIWASSGSGAYSVIMGPQQTIPGDNDYNIEHAHWLNNTAQTGYLDSAWDHFAYYKCFLAQGENLRVRMNLTQNVPGKFNLYIYHVTAGTYYQDTNTSNFVAGTGWTNTVTVTWTALADNKYYIIPMADEAHDASGKPASGASNATFTLRIEAPDPLSHAPVLVNPPSNPYPMPEDSVHVPVGTGYLMEWFEEMDGEGMSFTVKGSGNISLNLLDSGWVLFATTTPDWSGMEKITITATDTSGKSTVFELNIVVYQVPDAPMLLKPLENQTVKEDEVLAINLSEYFTDADMKYIPSEHLEYRITSMDPVVPTIRWSTNNDTQALTIGPAVNTNHQQEFYNTRRVTLRVTDKGGDEVHARNFIFNLTVVHINHPPLVNPPIIYLIIDEDGVDSSKNIQPYFTDYDIPMGDVLQFKAVRSEHINATIKPGYILEVKPEKNWNGEETLYVTATDLENETATLEVNVTVNAVDDPPEFVLWSPVSLEWYINETETLNLSVVAIDADTNVSELTYTWFVDGVRQFGANTPAFVFITDYKSSRPQPYVISVNVSDGEVNSTLTWNILVYNRNQPPIVEISSPLEGGIYPEGQMIRLSADASDPEFDTLTYSWKEGNITLGRTRSINWKFAPGNHTVTIYVDDGTDTTVKNVTFFSDSVPTINITAPADRRHFKTTDNIQFSATAFDRDGNTVTVEWRDKYGKGSVLSRGLNFNKTLSKGAHEIVLNATDGRNPVETPSILIFVDEPPKNGGFLPGFELLASLAAVVAAAATVSLFWRGRRGRGAI